DISDRKKYEEELDKNLHDKEVLLQEIHHRVKNNLAIIVSLLELQKDELDMEMQDVFKESQSRIQSIALVHEKLYQTESLSNISLAEYIRELTDVISSAYHTEKRDVTTDLILDDENINLDINQAIPVGLIYNELVNNAYKHGFSGNKKGSLKVMLGYDGEEISLSVADNGKGLPEDFDLEGAGSLGMVLVNTLAQQLGADLMATSNEWTEFRISFKPKD
ncbi:MAG: sensor histidine kinase, partial [Candidatus Cyclobacteriaceae bacterium M2_1C_046]